MKALNLIGNWVLVILLAYAAIAVLGLWMRGVTYLFCLGYGC